MQISDLEKFETCVYQRKYEDAYASLVSILSSIENNYGGIQCMPTDLYVNPEGEKYLRYICTRLASAITSLFSDPEFKLSADGYLMIICFNRWLSAIFNVTHLRNTDHVIRLFIDEHSKCGGDNLVKYAAIYNYANDYDLPIDMIYQDSHAIAITLAMALISYRVVIGEKPEKTRDMLLGWLPGKLEEQTDLKMIPIDLIHNTMMHSSYSLLEEKHALKPALNRLIRRDLMANGYTDADIASRGVRAKPVMVVVLDWWNARHAMYRCYAEVVRACKAEFTVIGLATFPGGITEGDGASEVFDEFHRYVIQPGDDIRSAISWTASKLKELAPDVVYYLSLGMSQVSIATSNLRLARLQVSSMGHPATAGAVCIDCMVSPEDFESLPTKPGVYYEKLLVLPSGTLTMIPPPVSFPDYVFDDDPAVVKVCVAASVMKINSAFLAACNRIKSASDKPVEFHFFCGWLIGITFYQVREMILKAIPDAVIYYQTDYEQYIKGIAQCHMFLCPFPFGNTNGIVDTAALGIPGVCLHGDQPHSAIDRGMFKLGNYPDELVATDVDQYVEKACKLANDAVFRRACHEAIASTNLEQKYNSGDPSALGRVLLEELRQMEVADHA